MLLDLYPEVSFPPPRPFQAATKDKLRERFLAGERRVIVCAPTGSGKTMLAMYLIHEALQKKKTALFVCDRISLIEQTSLTAFRHGLRAHGIIQADNVLTDYSLPFQIGSVQTLGMRGWPKADLIIIDEAHTRYRSWTDHIQTCGAFVVGLTATPFTAGLIDDFDSLLNATRMADLVADGTLVPMRVFAARRIDMQGASKSDGEWTSEAAGQRGMQIVGDVVAEYQRHAWNRKAICFGATIKHCEELARQFNENGIMAAVYCQNTTEEQRRDLVAEFKKPDSVWRVLVSVEALAKGFDQPDVSCIIDCRPLRKSFSTYVQMVGRGLRASPETGKVDCIVLDHSGNSMRFAADFAQLYAEGVHALKEAEKLDKTVRKEPQEKEPACCPSCGFYPFASICMGCGFTITAHSTVEHVEGELEEVVLGGKTLAPNHRDLFNQLLTHARRSRQPDPDKQWWRARYLYRDIIGMLPPSDWTLANSPEVAVTRETRSRIQHNDIRRAKGKAKGDLLSAI